MKYKMRKKTGRIIGLVIILAFALTFFASAGSYYQNVTVTVIDKNIPIPVNIVVVQECNSPDVYVDHTARGWFPNDQTKYTADYYGTPDKDGKYDCFAADDEYDRWFVSERMNYAFEGETIDYYVLVRDEDGKEDIDTVQLVIRDGLNDIGVGACRPVEDADCAVDFDADAFGVDALNDSTDQVFICKLIVPAKSTWANGRREISVKVKDGAMDNGCSASTVKTVESDLTYFNPPISLTLTGNSNVNFGSVSPGSVATSNSIYLANQIPGVNQESGVVMDIYIASDDYFTDPDNENAICPIGNGIKYDRFSYYATKGSLNSGDNNNDYPGLGKKDINRQLKICWANDDEFTTLPSHSGNIDDMCRVINWKKDGSLLSQGSEMSITFRLDVPDPCVGNFNNGQFHFAGRVV